MKKISASFIVLCAVCAVSFLDVPRVFAELPKGFDLEAHRGGRDARPENTLPAFAYAMALGVTTLEMDMQITKDGVIVICHTPELLWFLARDTKGNYIDKNKRVDIRTMTLAEVKSYDLGAMSPQAGEYWDLHGATQIAVPGTRIATLEEVFQLAQKWGNKDIFFNIETKSFPGDPLNPPVDIFVKKFYDVVKKYQMQNRVLLQSFDWRTLVEMKRIDPNILTVALTSEQPSWGADGCYRWVGKKETSPWMAGLNINDFNGDYVKAAHQIKCDVVSPYYEELTPELIKEAHSFGMKVVPWTVNNPADMARLIEWGVDGMISDKPAILREVLKKKKIAVPAPTPAKKGMPYYTGTDWGKNKKVQKAAGGKDASY